MPECEVLMTCLILEYHKWLKDTVEPDRFLVKKNIAELLTGIEGLDAEICSRTLDILEEVLFETDMPAGENISESDATQKKSVPVEKDLSFTEDRQHTTGISDLRKIKAENDKSFTSFAQDIII